MCFYLQLCFKNTITFCLVFIICMGFVQSAFSQDDLWSFRLYGQTVPGLFGDAGSGGGEPEYDDAFDLPFGVGLELGYQFDPSWELLLGAAYEGYYGDSFDGIEFENWSQVPLYAGVKYHIPFDNPKWDPYIRLDIGTVYMSGLDVSFGGVSDTYWDDSWSFMGDAGIGLQYNFERVSVFLEVKGRYIDNPAEEMGLISEADDIWSIPIAFGIHIPF